jgi:hypothetical protein
MQDLATELRGPEELEGFFSFVAARGDCEAVRLFSARTRDAHSGGLRGAAAATVTHCGASGHLKYAALHGERHCEVVLERACLDDGRAELLATLPVSEVPPSVWRAAWAWRGGGATQGLTIDKGLALAIAAERRRMAATESWAAVPSATRRARKRRRSEDDEREEFWEDALWGDQKPGPERPQAWRRQDSMELE